MELQIPRATELYLLTHAGKDFKPVPRYSATGDMLEIHFESEPAFAETVNEHLNVLRAFSDRRVVGVKVFGVATLVDEARRDESDGC